MLTPVIVGFVLYKTGSHVLDAKKHIVNTGRVAIYIAMYLRAMQQVFEAINFLAL